MLACLTLLVRNRRSALRSKFQGVIEWLGFPLKVEKTVAPDRRMVALGALVDLDSGRVALDRDRARRYRELLASVSSKKSIRLDDWPVPHPQ